MISLKKMDNVHTFLVIIPPTSLENDVDQRCWPCALKISACFFEAQLRVLETAADMLQQKLILVKSDGNKDFQIISSKNYPKARELTAQPQDFRRDNKRRPCFKLFGLKIRVVCFVFFSAPFSSRGLIVFILASLQMCKVQT